MGWGGLQRPSYSLGLLRQRTFVMSFQAPSRQLSKLQSAVHVAVLFLPSSVPFTDSDGQKPVASFDSSGPKIPQPLFCVSVS